MSEEHVRSWRKQPVYILVALTPSTVGQRHQSIRGCVVKSVAFGCGFMSSPIVLGCVCRLDLGRSFSAMVWCLRCVRTGQRVSINVLQSLKKVHWIWKSNKSILIQSQIFQGFHSIACAWRQLHSSQFCLALNLQEHSFKEMRGSA